MMLINIVKKPVFAVRVFQLLSWLMINYLHFFYNSLVYKLAWFIYIGLTEYSFLVFGEN